MIMFHGDIWPISYRKYMKLIFLATVLINNFKGHFLHKIFCTFNNYNIVQKCSYPIQQYINRKHIYYYLYDIYKKLGFL